MINLEIKNTWLAGRDSTWQNGWSVAKSGNLYRRDFGGQFYAVVFTYKNGNYGLLINGEYQDGTYITESDAKAAAWEPWRKVLNRQPS